MKYYSSNPITRREPSKRKERPVVVQEGPIFLSTKAVRGSTILPQAMDCHHVGLRPDRPPSHLASPNSERILDLDKLPLDEEDIPDIEREMTKSTLQDTMVRHPSLCNMTFKVVNVAYAPVWLQFHTEFTTVEMLVVAKEKIEPLSRYRVTVVYSTYMTGTRLRPPGARNTTGDIWRVRICRL